LAGGSATSSGARSLSGRPDRLCRLLGRRRRGDQFHHAGDSAHLPGSVWRILAPAALSLLSSTFSDPRERGKAFGVYLAIAAGGGAVGLVLGGVLTEYLSWRWCLYVNLFFAGIAAPAGWRCCAASRGTGAGRGWTCPAWCSFLPRCSAWCTAFSNASSHSWHTPSTYGFLAVGVGLLAAFAVWQGLASHSLLPPRVVLDRNRGG
jgi:MFS family permease